MYIFRVKPHIGYILLRHNRYMFDIFVFCILSRRLAAFLHNLNPKLPYDELPISS